MSWIRAILRTTLNPLWQVVDFNGVLLRNLLLLLYFSLLLSFLCRNYLLLYWGGKLQELLHKGTLLGQISLGLFKLTLRLLMLSLGLCQFLFVLSYYCFKVSLVTSCIFCLFFFHNHVLCFELPIFLNEGVSVELRPGGTTSLEKLLKLLL